MGDNSMVDNELGKNLNPFNRFLQDCQLSSLLDQQLASRQILQQEGPDIFARQILSKRIGEGCGDFSNFDRKSYERIVSGSEDFKRAIQKATKKIEV